MADEKYYLYLRPVSEQDLEIIHSWRIKKDIFQLYLNVDMPPSWVETLDWWYKLGKARVFIVMMTDEANPPVYWRGRRIGLMWMRFDEAVPRVGGYIGDTALKGDVFMQAMQLLLEAVKMSRGNTKVMMSVNWKNEKLITRLQRNLWKDVEDVDENLIDMMYNIK